MIDGKAEGRFEDKLMRFIKKLLAPKEVRAALGVLDELECTFDCSAFRMVRHQIEEMILAKPWEFAAVIRNKGTPVRQWILGAVSKLAGDLVESGEYHIYRGTLDPMGKDLLRIYNASSNELVQMGVLASDYVAKQQAALWENIQDVG